VESPGLESRAGELGLSAEELSAVLPGLRDGVANVVLAALIRYDDALAELGGADRSDSGDGS